LFSSEAPSYLSKFPHNGLKMKTDIMDNDTRRTNQEDMSNRSRDGQQAPPDAPVDGISDSGKVTALNDEVATLHDRWMRAEAEIANVRARAKRDIEDAKRYAVQKFATDVVEAAENLRRGLSNIPPSCKRRTGNRDALARWFHRCGAGLPRPLEAQRHRERGPDKRDVRQRASPGDFGTGFHATARHSPTCGHFCLDPAWPVATPGNGDCRKTA